MGFLMIDAQREIIVQTIRAATRGEWKVLILDQSSKRLVDNVVKEDDILNENITHIELIEQRRQLNREIDAVYLLSPQPHIVECVLADFEKRRYRRSNLIWTSLLHPNLRDRIDKSHIAREQIATFKVLHIDFYPRESHLVTFRDPWEFPVLFHPDCNSLVRKQMEEVAQKIVGVCVALGEYPIIRYYKPNAPRHEASVLCSHLARFVQDELDMYAKFHNDFPPNTGRARGLLYIVDRSMDVFAPLLHEFTYQAMAFDLLSIKEGNKVTYQTTINEGRINEEKKDLEIAEKDKIWVENRHRHMKDTIEKLMGDFQRFMSQNPQFAQSDGDDAPSLNTIKDMIAGLPQFQEMKEAYSLHLSMAQECMNKFEKQKLPDVASIEQILATGLDEDYRKPKNLTDQVVRTLDDDAVTPVDRLRLLTMYLIYRDGVLTSDLQRLLQHAQLPLRDMDVLQNLSLLGVRTSRNLKEVRPPAPPLFPPKIPVNQAGAEEYALSRFEPALKSLLDAHATSTVDSNIFPYTKPPLDEGERTVTATSLRTAKPTWAKKSASSEPRQRVIVYVAGGATYSESRACYESSSKHNKEVVLVTSHMQTPGLFIRQLNDLSQNRRQLGIPSEGPQPKAPQWIFEGVDTSTAPGSHQGSGTHNGHGHGHGQSQGHHGYDAQSRKSGPRAGQGGFGNPRATPPPAAPSPSITPNHAFDQSARARPPEPPPVGAMANMRLDGAGQNGRGQSPIRLGPGGGRSSSPAGGSPMMGQQGKFSKEPEKKKKHHFFGKRKD